MKNVRLLCWLAAFAALAAVISMSSPAQAQIAFPGQAYASPAGTGNVCATSEPCPLLTALNSGANFISCIDGATTPSSFDLNNDISFTVDCPGGVITTSNGPFFTLTGTSSQVVVLRNLTFHGGLVAPFIKVTGGTTLIIENCKFEGSAATPAIAIEFQPTHPAAQLIIRDSVFANNGTASSGGGLQVAPGAGGSASVVLERVSFNFNVAALALSGPVSATMIDSTVSASRGNGILVGSGSTLDIVDSKLVYNVGSAVSISSGGTLTLSNTDIRHNQIGVTNSGGQALSYKNNRISGNGSTATLGTIAGGQ